MNLNKEDILENGVLEVSATGVSIVNIDNTYNANNILTKISDSINKDISKKSLSTSGSSIKLPDLLDEKNTSPNLLSIILPEGNVLTGWQLVTSISARLIDFDDEYVKLECLVDKENRIYEEQEFKISYFDGYSLELGKVFKLCWSERKNQVMMEVKDNPKLVLEDDFPKSSFASKFSNLKIKK